MVRSLYTAPSGQPHFGARTFVTDHSSPFSERWGGYYVTGTHGSMRHMGNTVIPLDQPTRDFDYHAGANLTRLDGLIDTDDYLSPHSDLVACLGFQLGTAAPPCPIRLGQPAVTPSS